MAVASLLVMLSWAVALGAPDWTDCQAPCMCKWSSGKKTALCWNGGLTHVPDTLDPDMQVVDLSENAIPVLSKDAFKNVGLLNLQRVYMRATRLKQVHRDAFRELTILVEVDLSDNEIQVLQPNTFFGNERLKVLCLNRNPIRRLVEYQFPALPYLKTLEMEGCHLETVDEKAFVHLLALESVNLKTNKLTSISEETFMSFSHLKSLALDGNRWKCDCALRNFRDWFLASNLRASASLICMKPSNLEGIPWEDVPSQHFACPPQVTLTPYPLVQAEAGGNVSFGCHVKGDPEPEVTWLYEDRPINHTWLVLEAEEGLLDKWANISVSNVSDADAGVYTCVAKNSLASASSNVTLVLPEVVTATTLSKSESRLLWWVAVCVGAVVFTVAVFSVATACCVRSRTRRHRRNMKASVSFTDQEKKLLDVSIATTTDRGTGSCEALGPDLDAIGAMEPVHITIESEPLPLAVYPPPPEFSTSVLPAGAYGNILISVSVSRDPTLVDTSRCPDLLDLPHRSKPVYHGMATLPRRPLRPMPQYDNMGPRVTAGGSSTLSLPGAAAAAAAAAEQQLQLPPPPISCHQPPPQLLTTSEFVSL